MAGKEIIFNENDFIVSKTDLRGVITYGNEHFITLSGFSEAELIGAPHNLLRHPDMPKVIFQMLWDAIRTKNEIFAYVVNKTKNHDYYWVFAHITPSIDMQGNIIGFHSVRRKPSQNSLETIRPLYHKLLSAEVKGGMAESKILLQNYLETTGHDYDEFIVSL